MSNYQALADGPVWLFAQGLMGRIFAKIAERGLLMSKNENDVLDSLLDSLSDDQEMEKKIDEFARNKERARRIQRARETSAQFQQTYSRSHNRNQESGIQPGSTQNAGNEKMPSADSVPDLPGEAINSAASQPAVSRTQEVDIPEFISHGSSQTVTIPLDHIQDQLNSSAGTQENAADQTRPYNPAGLEAEKPWQPGGYNLSGSYSASYNDQHNANGTSPYNPNPYEYPSSADATRPMPPYGAADFGSYPDTRAFEDGAENNGYGYPSGSGNPENMGATRQIQSGIPSYSQPDQEDTQTRVFNSAAADNAGGTVRVSNDEIRSLLDKEEPILKREYVRDEDDDDYEEDEGYYKKIRSSSSYSDRPRRKKRSPWKGYAIVCGIVLAAVLVGTGGMMIKNFVDSSMQSVTNSDGYNKLMDWVNNYNSYDDAKKKDILNFRRTYEKLSDEDKAKIDDALVGLTGKTFDELLAAAGQSDKPQSSNENIANAEKKAQIKDKITSIQNEIENTLQPQLDSMNSRISAAETDYNNKNAAYTTAQNNEANALNTLNYWQSQLANIPSDDALQAQILSLQNQLESLDHPNDDDHDDSQNSGSNGSDNAEKVNLQAQIFQLQSELKNNPAKRSELEGQVSQAQSAYTQAQQDTSAAKQAAETAYGAWQAIKNDAQPIQSQIDQRNADISKLQSELDSIN